MRLFRAIRLVLGIPIAATLVACDARGPLNTMSGCYTTAKDGKPDIKIWRRGDTAYAKIEVNGKWTDSTALREASKAELFELFKNDTARIATALVAEHDPFGVFEMTQALADTGIASTTKYVYLFFLGIGPMFKVRCSIE